MGFYNAFFIIGEKVIYLKKIFFFINWRFLPDILSRCISPEKIIYIFIDNFYKSIYINRPSIYDNSILLDM